MATSLFDAISTTGDVTLGTDGSGNLVVGTGNTTIAIANTVATTVNAFGAASTALNIGHASGTNTILGASTFSQDATFDGDAHIDGGSMGIGVAAPLGHLHIEDTGSDQLIISNASSTSNQRTFRISVSTSEKLNIQLLDDSGGFLTSLLGLTHDGDFDIPSGDATFGGDVDISKTGTAVLAVESTDGNAILEIDAHTNSIGRLQYRENEAGVFRIDWNGTANELQFYADQTLNATTAFIDETTGEWTWNYDATFAGDVLLSQAATPTITLTDTTTPVTTVLQSSDGAGILGTTTAHQLLLRTNSTNALTIDSSQDAVFAGDVDVDGGQIVAGVNTSVQGTLTLWDGGGGNTPAYILMHSPNGTAHYLFFEDDGTLKQHTSAPTANGDGNVIGAQT